MSVKSPVSRSVAPRLFASAVGERFPIYIEPGLETLGSSTYKNILMVMVCDRGSSRSQSVGEAVRARLCGCTYVKLLLLNSSEY